MLLVIGVAVTAYFCFSAYAIGGYVYNKTTALDHLRMEDGAKYDGVLVGVYDRAAVFLTKPSNHVLVLSQKSSFRVEHSPPEAGPSLGGRYWEWLLHPRASDRK